MVPICCHPLTLQWFLNSRATNRLQCFLWPSVPNSPNTFVLTEARSHLRPCMTAPRSSCWFLIVPCPRGCWEQDGRGWTFSPGWWGEVSDRTLAVSGASAEKRDGEVSAKETVGSRVVESLSFRCREKREALRRHPSPALAPVHKLMKMILLVYQNTTLNKIN